VTIETSFLPWLHFLWCMTHRSLHTITKVYYRSMSCFATVPRTNSPRLQCHPHSTEHDTQPIVFQISKHVVPYWTRGGTCYPGGSTSKIRSLANSSVTDHITWWNPTISTIPPLLKPHHRSSPRWNHISTDGRPSLTKTKSKLNITKDGKTCMTLMTAWLSITNQVWTQILKYEA
jgi:hypothetical protein